MDHKIILKPGNTSLTDLRLVSRWHVPLELSEEAYNAIDKSQKAVQKIINSGDTVYSINTGFGDLAKVRIKEDKFETLQKNLLLSHAAGVGRCLDNDVVRLVLFLKINALSQGYSGIRREVIDGLIALYNNEVYPCVPQKGSVGASGDLAPLAHLCLPLLGLGQVHYKGEALDSAAVLEKIGLQPLELGPKEGLALLNGTQVSTALALYGLFATEDIFAAAIVAGALSVDASMGSTTPFRPEIQKLRGQQGQIDVAGLYINLLKGSAIRDSHEDEVECARVQDPYCLRCQPQVMGACLDQIRFVADILERESNAVTDNPLIFADTGEALSGGNFHAEPVAMAADNLALAIAEIGAISERRIAMLIDSSRSGLPPFLVEDAGINSGFMIAHVTAAALASENKQRSFPACVDSLPTSANQEDHVSMATHGARRTIAMAKNTANIIGIEILAATQGIGFKAPLKTSSALQSAIDIIREKVDPYEEDHYFAPDIREAFDLIQAGAYLPFIGRGILPSIKE